jgi:hypothetical protein
MSTENQVKNIDYRDFTPKGQRPERKDKDVNIKASAVRWWLQEDDLLPAAVMAQVATIIQADRGRIDAYNTYAKLYGTWTPTFWNGYQLSNSGKPTAPMRDRLTYNIVQSCIDTLTSRIIANKPKPMFLTSAGDSKLQRRAKKLDSFCYGLFYENHLYTMAPKGFRDGCVFGEGFIHPYSEGGRVKYERVLPYELLVDYLESHYGPESTKSIFRIKNIDRTQLAEDFPEHAEDIAKMSNTSTFISANNRSIADTVTVVEAHRLPVGSKPGRHVIVTQNTILLEEDYEDDFFPYACSGFNSRLYGFYNQGMAEQLVPAQVEINRTLISIQRSLYLGGTHKIFVKAGSKVIKSHFDNMIGTILEYAGDTMPQYVTPQLVQGEIYSHLDSMIQKAYQLTGVSQMSASNLKQPGIDSGKALRTMDNIENQRFSTISQNYEQFFVDLARITVSVAKKTYEAEGNFKVKVPGKRFIQTIDWKDVDLDNDEFSLQIYPVSKLPQDPEGRLASIQEMMAGGLLTPEAGRRLLDYPDLDAEENLANATSDYLHKILDKMVEDGEFTAPEPFDDLQQARKLALEYYAQGKLNEMDEDKLELLRQFMSQIDTLTQPPPMPIPGMPAVGGAGAAPTPIQPQGNPLPPPTSNLIQATNGPIAS